MHHTMTIAGLERNLPLCRVTDDLYIGAFVIFGDAPLTVACAAELLKNEDLPAGKVCELVGFRSESLFYQNFKAVMGITPKAYAKQHRNK